MLFFSFGKQLLTTPAITLRLCCKRTYFVETTRHCLAKKRQTRSNFIATTAVKASKADKCGSVLPGRAQETVREGADKLAKTKLQESPAISSRVKAKNKLQSVALEVKVINDIGRESNSETAVQQVSVDVLRVVEEWGRVCEEVNDVDSETGIEMQGDNNGGSTSFQAVAGVKGAATFAAFLARAAKGPEDYPVLNHILHIHKQHNLVVCDVKVLQAENVVRNLQNLSALVTFLRVYRTSTFGSFRVYEAIMGELVEAIIIFWKQGGSGVTKKDEDDGATANVKTALIWLLLELKRNYIEGTTSFKAKDASTEKGKTKRKVSGGGGFCDHRKWLDVITERLLSEVAVFAADCVLKKGTDRVLSSFTEGVVDMVLVFFVSVMAKELRQHTERIDFWEKSALQTRDLVDDYLQRKASEEALRNSSLNSVRVHAFDLLDSLLLLSMVDTVISIQLRERMRRDAADFFLKLCGTVEMKPAIFSFVFCTSEMAEYVQALPSKDLVDILHAAIFTGAALFCERANEDTMNEIIQRIKVKITSKVDGGDIDVDVDSQHDDEIYAKQFFPRSRRAKVAFALFHAGYNPEAVLGSGLCVGHNALEVLELVNAAGLFSRSFVFSPLPARLSALLITESETFINAHIRAQNRAGSAHTDEYILESKTLRDIWDEYMSLESSESLSKDIPVTFSTVLYMSLTTAVELLVRGEERKLSAQLVRLLALLEREGSYHYLIDGLSLLIDGCVERFRLAGHFQRRTKKCLRSCTSLEVERSLSEVTALFVSRVVEAVQRRIAKVKRDSAMGGAEGEFAARILQEMLHFTVYVAACGMNATTAKQLVGVHTMLVKGLVSYSSDDSLSMLSETVVRMNFLVSQIAVKRKDFGIERHHASPGLRHCSVVINDVVAAHLKPIAAAIRRGCRIAASQERYQLLSLVSLLFRLVSENAVEAEPAELRAFRTDVLDPALTRVLQEQNSGSVNSSETLDLAALSEITVVMCLPHTIHHFSLQLLDQLAVAVTVAASKQVQLSGNEEQRRQSSKTAARLLVAVSPVCQLRQEERTTRYLAIVQALGPLLLPAEVPTVLRSFATYHVPVDSDAVTALRTLLADEAGSPKSSLSFPETVSALQVLCDLGDTSQLAYTTILRRLINSGYQLSPGEVGIVVRIATKLQQLGGSVSSEDLQFLQGLSASLAVEALRFRQQCSPSDVPLVLQGFSQLDGDKHGDLRDRVMKAYILRTIQVRLLLSPKEVVECLESYAAARITHQYLFGVLLARVTDLKLKFSLPLAVRLVKCGVNATWDKSVQTACLTAAQPVFLGLLRYLLQTDPASLPSVSSNAVMVLQCLTEAFPNDPTSDLVLQNMVSHYTALSLSTMMAVLRLVARKSSTEYNILRCMTEHSANTLFPKAAPKAFAELTHLFVHCGVRSRVLFEAVSKRFKEISSSCDWGVLSILAETFIVAHVDLEQRVIPTFVEHTVALLKKKHLVFELSNCVSVLKLFSHLELKNVAHATTLLLECSMKALNTNREGFNGLETLSADDINVFLSACLRVDSERHGAFAKSCCDALLCIFKEELAGETRACSGSQMDLMLVVQLANNAARLRMGDHPVVSFLFDIMYDKRSGLMRRRLLLQTAIETMKLTDEHTHPQLYALLVKGKLVA